MEYPGDTVEGVDWKYLNISWKLDKSLSSFRRTWFRKNLGLKSCAEMTVATDEFPVSKGERRK